MVGACEAFYCLAQDRQSLTLPAIALLTPGFKGAALAAAVADGGSLGNSLLVLEGCRCFLSHELEE